MFGSGTINFLAYVSTLDGLENPAQIIDFRELVARDDIDAISLATPDHWHAIPALLARYFGYSVALGAFLAGALVAGAFGGLGGSGGGVSTSPSSSSSRVRARCGWRR